MSHFQGSCCFYETAMFNFGAVKLQLRFVESKYL